MSERHEARMTPKVLAEQLGELPLTQVGKAICGVGMRKDISRSISGLVSL